MGKKVYAICGSPRKGYNTDQLLQSYLRGVSSVSSEIDTEIVYLYDYEYKGCVECMACKRKAGKSYGQCGFRDSIWQLLQDVSQSDAVVFGSPVYFYEMTAHLRAFLERLMYPYTQFKKGEPHIIAPKKLHTDFIYTMNVTEREMKLSGYPQIFSVTEDWVAHVFGGQPQRLCSCYTYQYKDYSLYEADAWDLELKEKMRREQFPKDLEAAFQMGRDTALNVVEE